MHTYQIVKQNPLFLLNFGHKTDVIAHIGKHDYSGINNSAKEKRLCMIH
ncbi:hypothetical protein ABN47_004241 [Salmonella enterica subsp. enterica serovar Hvittingfoss]|nr:hypothetical protein [Salmonella enterica subsp. enterica serovar Hvittingfoss]